MFNEDGSVNEACSRARAIYGLPPLVQAINVLPTTFEGSELVD